MSGATAVLRIAVCALALGTTLLVPHDALARGKKSRTIELTRPAGAPDADAAGTVEITHRKNGDRKLIELSHLDARTRFEVRDSATGALLGTVRTDRKGHATFNLSRSLAKAASARGSNAVATGGVSSVDIVDPDTGDEVLTGDVQTEPVAPRSGYSSYLGVAGVSADVFLLTAPDDALESFSLDFYPASDPTANAFSYYELDLDSSHGDKLPLGVASVSELAGRRFEIVAPDGSVVLDDKLPELVARERYPFEDGVTDWSGGWSEYGFGDWGSWAGTDDPSTSDSNDTTNTARHGHSKAKRARGRKADASTTYALLIADAAGVLQNAGLLKQETISYGPLIDDSDDEDGEGNSGDGDSSEDHDTSDARARHHRR